VPQTTSDEGVVKLFEIFKPIKVGLRDRAFRILPGADLFKHSFLWDAKLEEAPIKEDLYVLDKLWTVHSYGYQGMFKPSIAEVMQQIPKAYSKLKLVYFETVGPEDASDLNLWVDHVQAGVHVAKTTLYLPEPTGDVMARYWHEHPEMLRMERRVTGAMSAVRWLENLDLKDRMHAMRFFCQRCGKRLKNGKLNTGVLDLDMDPPDENYCEEHSPDKE